MSLGENQLKKDVIQWRSLEVMEVRERLGTNRPRGLTLDEAGQRLAHEGPHPLPPPRRRPHGGVFSWNSDNFLVYMMRGAAEIVALFSHR